MEHEWCHQQWPTATGWRLPFAIFKCMELCCVASGLCMPQNCRTKVLVRSSLLLLLRIILLQTIGLGWSVIACAELFPVPPLLQTGQWSVEAENGSSGSLLDCHSTVIRGSWHGGAVNEWASGGRRLSMASVVLCSWFGTKHYEAICTHLYYICSTSIKWWS